MSIPSIHRMHRLQRTADEGAPTASAAIAGATPTSVVQTPPSPKMAMFWKDARNTDVVLRLCTSSIATSSVKSGKRQPASDNASTSFHLHSMVLASSSPYFFSDNVDGLIKYAHDPMSSDNKGKRKLAGSNVHGCLQLVEYVEEEEVPGMEAVLRHFLHRGAVRHWRQCGGAERGPAGADDGVVQQVGRVDYSLACERKPFAVLGLSELCYVSDVM